MDATVHVHNAHTRTPTHTNPKQILNRTNNIFELVTVEPVPDRLETHNRDILGPDIDNDDQNRNLRLKGK